jgi:uncharacterized protein YndB with AHSA1/START domain
MSDVMIETEQPTVRWPEGFEPACAQVFAHNEIIIPAPVETVWAWLIRAEDWPDWYANARNIHFLSHAAPDLRNRSRFRWKTFGLGITSKVLEFEPYRRLGWDAQGIGVKAWHAWVLTPLGANRTHVLTEETQTGWLARLARSLFPSRLQTQHQIWLEGLSLKAQSGPPA